MVRIAGTPVGSSHSEFSVNNTPDTGNLHQSSHSRSGHLNSSFSEFPGDFRATVTTLTFPVNLSDQTEDFLGFYLSCRRLPMKPTIVATAAHFEHFTHPRGGRFSTANIRWYIFTNWNIGCRRGTVALGEDAYRGAAPAFFNMSRSISASHNCFFSLVISVCSDVNEGFPWPEKLPSLFCLYSRFQRLSRSARISNSFATSPVGLPDRQSSTGHRARPSL